MTIRKQTQKFGNAHHLAPVAGLMMILAAAALGSAPNLYVAQGGASGASGSSCASALPVSFFNNSASWGAASNQIGPGTTVHLCGTFTAGAGTTGLLQFQGGGTAGNPVTLLFESGAGLTAPYWGSGAITASGVNYIVIDGGTNGIIQATQNGTALANHADSRGISLQGVSNSEIRNLTLANLYVHTANTSDEGGQESYAVFWNGGNNLTLDHNTCHDVRTCFIYGYSGSATSSGVSIYSNTVYNVNWGIIVGDGNANAILNAPVAIHDNVIHDFALWDDDANYNHHDGVYCFAANTSSALHACSVYNNYIYGDPGTHQNTFIFASQNTDGLTCDGVKVFNNVLVNGSTTHFPANGLIQDWCTNTLIANNTLIGSSTTDPTSAGLSINLGQGASIMNNTLSNFTLGIYMNNQGGGSLSASDNNNFYNVANIGSDNVGNYYTALTDWTACTGNGCPAAHDQHSNAGSPNLSAQFSPQSGSALIQAGANLTSLGIAALNTDKASTQRPTSGAWDMGAYASGATASTTISVSVNPLTLSLAGGAQQQFAATINSTAGVKWSLSPGVGAISSTGLYVAPTVITTQQTVQVTATAVADTSKSATATITLTPAGVAAPITLSVSPGSTTVAPGAQQQFVANVSGSTMGAKWSVSPQVGTLSAAGLYTAPASVNAQQSVMVTATALADATKTASAMVTITPPAVTKCSATISGAKSVITGPGGVQLTISLARSTTGTVTWAPLGAQCP